MILSLAADTWAREMQVMIICITLAVQTGPQRPLHEGGVGTTGPSASIVRSVLRGSGSMERFYLGPNSPPSLYTVVQV